MGKRIPQNGQTIGKKRVKRIPQNGQAIEIYKKHSPSNGQAIGIKKKKERACSSFVCAALRCVYMVLNYDLKK